MSKEIELSWDEIKRSDMPLVCFRCGADAFDFVAVEIEADNFFEEMTATIPIPLCEMHGETKGLVDHGVRADTFHNKGVIFKNACEGFADALEDYRDDPKAFKRDERRRDENKEYDKYKYGSSRGGRAVRSGVRKSLVFGCLAIVLIGVMGIAVIAVMAGGRGQQQQQKKFGR